MKKPNFVNNYIFHLYNRGVDKRDVFSGDKDYLRFIHDLFEFNDIKPASQCLEVEPPSIEKKEPRKLLVEILAFCLMPNHYHLLVKQKVDGGIINFMQKVGTGYTMYFNQKNERVGSLFQGRFKAVLVNHDRYFKYLPHYIHLNPLDLVMPEWREHKIKDFKKALRFLEQYKWSSFPDYIGNKNFPSVTQRGFLSEFLGNPMEYKKATQEWLKTINLEEISDLALE